jgi:hypothetical protein
MFALLFYLKSRWECRNYLSKFQLLTHFHHICTQTNMSWSFSDNIIGEKFLYGCLIAWHLSPSFFARSNQIRSYYFRKKKKDMVILIARALTCSTVELDYKQRKGPTCSDTQAVNNQTCWWVVLLAFFFRKAVNIIFSIF